MEQQVRCPSGMVGIVRPLKVADEKLFTSKQLINSGKIVAEICRRTWVRLLDPGPYSFENDQVDWDEVLQGDVFYLFFQVRSLSYGPIYEFSFPCEVCGKSVMTSVNIDEDLFVREFTPKSANAFKTGTPLVTKLEDGRTIHFRQLRMRDEEAAANLAEGRDLPILHAMTVMRILAIEGIETRGNKPDYIEFTRFIEKMRSGEFDLLREQMEEQECGLDTQYVAQCSNPNCGEESVIDIPLQITFFQQRRARTVAAAKKRREKLREQKEQLSKDMNG